MEDGPAGDGELLVAGLALPERPGAVRVDRDAAAGRADGLTVRGVPAERPEVGEGLSLAHARDREDAERPGGGGEEEVGRHVVR